jgi:hypothetical protein
MRARLTAGVAALAVGARLATDVMVLGLLAGPLAACTRLATLDAAALGAYASTRLAALALALSLPKPL